METQASLTASRRVRDYLGQRLEQLRARLARYREGDRLGGEDAAAVLAELLRLRALAALAGLPAGANELLAGRSLEAWPLARSLLRFETLLGDEGMPARISEAALGGHWLEMQRTSARKRLRGLAARALSNLARLLAGKDELAPSRLDGKFHLGCLPLVFLGLERELAALLRCQVTLYRALADSAPAPSAAAAAAEWLEGLALALREEVEPPCLEAPGGEWRGNDGLPADGGLAALARREFARLGAAFRPPAGDSLVHDRMLLAAYKLRLHCRALGLAHFAAAFDSADRLLLAHWNAQAVLDARARAGLRALAALLLRFAARGAEEGPALYLCELALLRLVHRRRGGEALQPREAHRREAAGAPLPLLMAHDLALLPAAEAHWFSNWENLSPRLPALLREVEFLERGAARLRVFRIETLAAALREVYRELLEMAGSGPSAGAIAGKPAPTDSCSCPSIPSPASRLPQVSIRTQGMNRDLCEPACRQPPELAVGEPACRQPPEVGVRESACAQLPGDDVWEPACRRLSEQELPRDLLIAAHRRLRAMLNQAAAWREVSPARESAAALLGWVKRRQDASGAEIGGPAPRSLGPALRRDAARLCGILDRQVHLEFSCTHTDAPPGSSLGSEARQALEALLRLVLGRPEESPWRRRARGKTAALNLRLCVEGWEKGLRLTLEADHSRAYPDAERFLRRQAGRVTLRVEADAEHCCYRLFLREAPPPDPSGPALP